MWTDTTLNVDFTSAHSDFLCLLHQKFGLFSYNFYNLTESKTLHEYVEQMSS